MTHIELTIQDIEHRVDVLMKLRDNLRDFMVPTPIVNVKLSGGDNVARVLKWGIRASSTNSPEVAVRAAIAKFCHRTGREIEHGEFKRIAQSGWVEMWTVNFPDQ